ncbi:MAG: DUF4422 domain-containing protein [Akkermansia sp.]
MNRIKIFPIYYKKDIIFRTNMYEPILAGANNANWELDMLKDNTGDHISDKNPYYGELTAWYWVWKNYLPKHHKLEYVGFCHYRRFLDLKHPPLPERNQPFLRKISSEKFARKILFEKLLFQFPTKKVYSSIKNSDIILTEPWVINETIYQHYIANHPQKDIDFLIDIIRLDYPDYVDDMNYFLYNKKGYFCLNFIMKTDLFCDFMTWVFDILNKLEMRSDFSQYSDYNTIRTPAFLIERFFNVWLIHQIKLKNLNIQEQDSYFLTPEFKKTN